MSSKRVCSPLSTVHWPPPSDAWGNLGFMHANHLGTTTVVTDHTGAVVQDQLVYPWRQQWALVGSPQDQHFASMQQLETDLNLYPTPNRRCHAPVAH